MLAAVRDAVSLALGGEAPQATPLRGRRAKAATDAPVLVAYSGGPDSTALLSLLCTLRDAQVPGLGDLQAVHVHHGLQREADAWAAWCERQCAAFAVSLTVQSVNVERRGRGLEAAAREARYQALAQIARELHARLVLTGHHLDDRLETFVLQWMRGAGLDGLAGIAEQRALLALPGAGTAILARPLLHIARAQIERYLQLKGLACVHDPSNDDVRLDRNAVRLRVMPELARLRTGFRAAAERSIELIAEGAEALHSIAREDLFSCCEGAPAGMLRLDRLAGLPPARRMLVLREWLAQAQATPAPRARLREALQQALHAGADARLLIRLGERELRRHRGLLCLHTPSGGVPGLHAVQWQGEAELAVPGWNGALTFTRTHEEGFGAQWLGAEPLELRPRTGGERFKPHPTRPSKRLKQIFQDAHIPEFARGALPLVWRDGRLIYVAGVGPDVRLLVAEGERVRIDWVGATRLL